MSKYQLIRDFPFPVYPWFQKKNVEEALDNIPEDEDIIVASYPKTGTTWLQYILLQITTQGELFPTVREVFLEKSPFLEVTGTSALKKMASPKIYKHHCPYNMVQKNKNSKCLYIYRNPADTFVSYFHFLRNMQDDPLLFDELFGDFLTGNIPYGRYFEHVSSFFDHKNDGNLLLVSYERLHENREKEILRIAKFIGDQYFQRLSQDESLLGKIIENTSFEFMNGALLLTRPCYRDSSEVVRKNVNFFRKGRIGDGKRSLSTDQMKCLQKLAMDTVKDSSLLKEWFGD